MCDHARNYRRVNTAAEVDADRHIGAQSKTNCIEHPLTDAFDHLFFRAIVNLVLGHISFVRFSHLGCPYLVLVLDIPVLPLLDVTK